jgi:PPOX class probable F420-dependent enzyme
MMGTRRRTGLPPDALRHLEHDEVAWLTTVTKRGAPSPTPVWFVWDGQTAAVFCEPDARKVSNIAAQPLVTLHFNSDPAGQDVVVISADAAVVTDGPGPSDHPGYLTKYFRAIGRLGMTVAEFDAQSTTRIQLTPIRAWLGA